jgi:ABC-type uncharacterized transport system permease subunit
MKAGHIICGIALVTLMSGVSFVLGQEQGGFAGNKVTNLTKSDLAGVANKQMIANIYDVPGLCFQHLGLLAKRFGLVRRATSKTVTCSSDEGPK